MRRVSKKTAKRQQWGDRKKKTLGESEVHVLSKPEVHVHVKTGAPKMIETCQFECPFCRILP